MMELLRLLPPETAHACSIFFLKLGFGPKLKNSADLSFTLFGKRCRNPIGLSGGADKEAAALPGWSKMGFGLVEAGTVTLKPRSGNPKPRIWRLPDNAIINWLGLPGGGIIPFIKNLKAFHQHPARKNLIVGASIASPDNIMAEFTMLAAACAPLVDYMTLNASCPNVEHDHDNTVKNMLEQIQAAKYGAGKVPLLLKLGPTKDEAALELMVKAALGAGINGFVVTNTVPFTFCSVLKSVPHWPMHDGKAVGGYSGPQLLEISEWMVAHIRKLAGQDIPIIGVGGVQSGKDAKRLMTAGANAVQLYTGLIYRGQGLIEEIAREIE